MNSCAGCPGASERGQELCPGEPQVPCELQGGDSTSSHPVPPNLLPPTPLNGWAALPTSDESDEEGGEPQTDQWFRRTGPDGEVFYEDAQRNRIAPPPPEPPDTSQYDYLLGATLRTESLWPLFLIGEDPRKNGSLIHGAIGALGTIEIPSYVWRTAGVAYRDHGRVPDRATLQAEALTSLRLDCRIAGFPAATHDRQASELVALLDACYGVAFDHLDIEQARTRVLGILTELLYTRQIQRAVLGAGTGLACTSVLERIEEIRQELKAFRADARCRWLSLEELEAQAANTEELIRGVLTALELGIFGGPTKSLKTLLALAAAIALATGTRWLGREGWEVPRPVRVGFISGESSAQALARKARAMLAAITRGLSQEQQEAVNALRIANLHFGKDLYDLSAPADVSRLLALVREQAIEVLFLDPLNGCLGTINPADTPALTRSMLGVAKRMAEANCTLILVHHSAGDRFRKQSGQAREPLELSDLAYPGITNSVRQWVAINRAEDYDHATRTSQLWLNIGGSGLQLGGEFCATIVEGLAHDQWQTRVHSRTDHIDAVQSQRNRQQANVHRERLGWLRRYLTEHQDGTCMNELIRAEGRPQGMGAGTIRSCLGELRREMNDRLVMHQGSRGPRYHIAISEGTSTNPVGDGA